MHPDAKLGSDSPAAVQERMERFRRLAAAHCPPPSRATPIRLNTVHNDWGAPLALLLSVGQDLSCDATTPDLM